MKRSKIRIILISIIILLASGRDRCHAFELNGTVIDEDEADKFAEYEMNAVLDLLDIKKWERRSPEVIEWNAPSDEPLGRYSEEALAPWLDGSAEIRVECEYYTGGYQPNSKKKVPVLIVKVYEDGRLTRLEEAISWGTDQRVEHCHAYTDIELLEWGTKYRKTDNGPLMKQVPVNVRPFTGISGMPEEGREGQDDGTCPVLNSDNIEQVMKTLLTGRDKGRLSELPLTERFRHQCMDEAVSIKDARNMHGLWLEYYGVGDDGKVICQCILSRYYNTYDHGVKDGWASIDNYYAYNVEMKLEDGQIDSMDIIFLGHYVLIGNTWRKVRHVAG